MRQEGRGLHAPSPVMVTLTAGDKAYLGRIAEERIRRRGYSRSADVWRRGVVANPVEIGARGEVAVGEYLTRRLGWNCKPDLSPSEHGDGDVDISVRGVKIQVKTCARESGANLVRRADRVRGLRPLTSDLFVFAHVTADGVALRGWVTRDDVIQCPFGKARVPGADWSNLEIPSERLRPMSDLPVRIRNMVERTKGTKP